MHEQRVKGDILIIGVRSTFILYWNSICVACCCLDDVDCLDDHLLFLPCDDFLGNEVQTLHSTWSWGTRNSTVIWVAAHHSCIEYLSRFSTSIAHKLGWTWGESKAKVCPQSTNMSFWRYLAFVFHAHFPSFLAQTRHVCNISRCLSTFWHGHPDRNKRNQYKNLHTVIKNSFHTHDLDQ